MKKQPRLYLHRTASDSEPRISRRFDEKHRPTAAEMAELPDMMCAVDAIQGANVPIQQVGVSNFKLPLKFA